MSWRIESRQKSVFGIGGHNYLALVRPDGSIGEEIHGHLSDKNGRLVRVSGLLEPEVEGAARPVLSGSYDKVKEVWDQMARDADGLSGKAVYGLLAPNSNSFWATVLRLSGFDYRQYEPNSRFPTPGTGTDLSDPLWWTSENRWPGVTLPEQRDDTVGVPAYRLP